MNKNIVLIDKMDVPGIHANFLEYMRIPYTLKNIDRKNLVTHYHNVLLTKDRMELFTNNSEVDCSNITFQNMKKIKNGRIIKIYSDGGSFNNGLKDPNLPQFASSATIITIDDVEVVRLSERHSDNNPTNNIGELVAGLNGLKYLSEIELRNDDMIIMVSDSQYLIKGLGEYLNLWLKRDWKDTTGNTIKNLDLWKTTYKYYLDILKQVDHVFLNWIKGHQVFNPSINSLDFDLKFNNEVDLMCNHLINELLNENNLHIYKRK